MFQEAIEKKSMYPPMVHPKIKGDVEAGFNASDVVLEGEARSDRQEHFYFEPQSSLVVPKIEQNEIEVFCSAQGADSVQVRYIYWTVKQKSSNCRNNRIILNISLGTQFKINVPIYSEPKPQIKVNNLKPTN